MNSDDDVETNTNNHNNNILRRVKSGRNGCRNEEATSDSEIFTSDFNVGVNCDEGNEEEDTNTSHQDELSLMEELILMTLDGNNTQVPYFNDSLPYVLRCCILLELFLAKRLRLRLNNTTEAVQHTAEPWKCAVGVSDPSPTGDKFLDETLKQITQNQGQMVSLEKWVNVLTGEMWNGRLAGCQMKNLRNRLCKSLVEKGTIFAHKSSILTFDFFTYSPSNPSFKRGLCFKVLDTCRNANINTRTKDHLRDVLSVQCIYAAGQTSKVNQCLDAPSGSQIKAFAKASIGEYKEVTNLKRDFGHLFEDEELYGISAVLHLFKRMNKILL